MILTRGRVIFSIGLGILFTVVVNWFGFWCADNKQCDERLSRVCFWQSNLLTRLVPPGPILRYEPSEDPVYEGTPIFLFIIAGGILSGVPIYSLGFFIVITGISSLYKKKSTDLGSKRLIPRTN
jgi:hypothetical protein